MESPQHQSGHGRASGEFVDSAVLEAVVPDTSNVDLQDLFQGWDGDFAGAGSSIVPFIAQRPFLFLDELVDVYVVLRTPAVEENDLKRYLSRLSLTLECHAVGQQFIKPPDPSHPPQAKEVKELLVSETISVTDDPLICATEIQSDEETESVQYIYIFWKVIIPIGRPKSRLQKLAIFFTPSASLTPPRLSKRTTNLEDAYLESQAPLSANLLEALAKDPHLAKSHPYLPSSIFSKSSTPVPLGKHRAIHGGPRKLFRAIPAFLWRIRFLRYPGLSEKEAILSALDIEVTQLAGSNVSIDKVIMQLSSGAAEPLGVELPHQCQPGEQLTLIYKINPPSSSDKSKDETASRTLGITLSASVLISSTCIPKVKIKWKTFLEMPQSHPTSNAGPTTPIGEVTEIGHDTLTMATPVADVEAKPAILPGLGITVVTPERIFAGEPFAWEILVVNRSDKPHRLAIVPLQKRHGEAGSRPNSMAGRLENTASIASPSLDEQTLQSLIRGSYMGATELVCLSPDVRIGPLAPTTCFSAQLVFLPLTVGVLHLDALRLIDLATQLSVEIKELPDIMVERRP